MASIHTSQGFVRALKAASDPPAPGGQFKIEIARQVWDDAPFYVPNKAEVVVEWIMSKFLKERDRETASNSILDLRFWTLLYDVISSSNLKAAETHTRPLKTWLPTLLSRIPFAPSLIYLLAELRGMDPAQRGALAQVVSACLAVIWPVATQKLNTEAILECFGTFIYSYVQSREPDENFVRIGIVVTSSYRNSLSNSSNKKKVYIAFLQNYLPRWLECATQSSSEEPYKTLLDTVYNAGAETLFHLDLLRQTRDSKTENTLFGFIAPVLSSNLEIYAVLPRIFSSYVEAIKKYRGGLVSQGSTQVSGATNAEIQAYGMQFFASCISLSDGQDQTTQSWSTRVSLLSLIDYESLFDRRQVEAEVLLNQVIEQALANLEGKTMTNNLATHAIESLSALARIDYDLVIPLVPRILPRLLSQGPSLPSLVFLTLILEYHTKTRTANTYIETLFSALLPLQTPSFQGSPREAYQTSLSSPLFEVHHLQHLSKAIQTFLAGSQALPTAEFTYRFLKDAWENFDTPEPDGEERSSKRRKMMDVDGTSPAVSRDHWAVVFALSAHISAAVFSSLPMHAVTEAIKQELQALLSEVRKFILRIVRKAMKVLQKLEADSTWSLSIVVAASLRVQYALDISGYISSPLFDDEKLCERISEAIQDETLLPELLIELSRFLFHVALKREQAATRAAFDHMLAYLEKNFKTSKASWSGQTHQLTLEKRGRRDSALALLHIIVERWFPVIEFFASTEQLERLIRIIMCINIADSEEGSSSGLQVQTLLLQTLHSAQFWELPKVRVIFLEYLHQVISTLDDDASDISVTSISNTIAAYRLLLILPVEYFTRPSRAGFIRQALTLDRRIASSSNQATSKYQHLTVLRTFLHRGFSYASTSDQSVQNLCDTLDYLMLPEALPSPHNENFVSTTMKLIESLFLEVFKRLENSSLEGVLSILRAFGQGNTKLLEPTIRARSTLKMIKVLKSNFKVTSFSDELRTSMRQLHQTLLMSTQPRISALEFDSSTAPELREHQTGLMALWCSLLSFGRWLAVTGMFFGLSHLQELYNEFKKDGHIPSFGRQLVTKIMIRKTGTSSAWDQTCVAASAILLEEFHLCSESDRLSHLEFILVGYIPLYHILGPSARQELNGYLSKTCNSLSVSEFSHVSELISQSLKKNSPSEECTYLLQISFVLLRDHPQGTLKQMQSFSIQCINAFASWRGLIDGPIELRLHTLEFIAQLCTEQPAVLRLGDMGGIWSLITRYLAGSGAHDDTTTLGVFHKIISITSALIRLRRDLVTHTLPHLGGVLRQLLMSLRTVRPNLGVKQTLLVTDTQPRWLNAKHPIGVEEVKVLARLLETLISKSMVRNNASSPDTQKAESLAKPFSKHAAYVLKAYVTAMNDPLCLLPSEHRKELQRGLFALCTMISDHSRDAMMVGTLDAGGKSTMKTLWKEYEKQRYVGKG